MCIEQSGQVEEPAFTQGWVNIVLPCPLPNLQSLQCRPHCDADPHYMAGSNEIRQTFGVLRVMLLTHWHPRKWGCVSSDSHSFCNSVASKSVLLWKLQAFHGYTPRQHEWDDIPISNKLKAIKLLICHWSCGDRQPRA